MKVGKDVVGKKKMTIKIAQKLGGISEKTAIRLLKDADEAKKFKIGSYVKIVAGKYALGKKGLVVGYQIAREGKKKPPHVFVAVMVTEKGKSVGVLKYPKNLKIVSPSYIS